MKIIDNGYSTDDYKPSQISIGAMKKYPEMLKFAPDHLKTKHTVKKWSLVIMYVPDWYKTQRMCDKAILENDEV